MFLFSVTKLFTTIATLQLIERGVVRLDNDTSSLLLELEAVPVSGETQNMELALKPRIKPITSRYILPWFQYPAFLLVAALKL